MELFNLLDTALPVFGQTYDVSLNWIGNLIRLLCGAVGVVGVGIILFSLILKLITLPLDVYQRISMRKQNLQMKANQAQMEKLQKQYANDKEKYNQKVMEMYKANGISMFSSCLPMIFSLIIFIVAINAFNAYAQYSNVSNYNTMVNAYNEKMYAYCVDDEITSDNYDTLVKVSATPEKVNGTETGNTTVVYTVRETGKFVYYTVTQILSEGEAQPNKDKAIALINGTPDKAYFVDVAAAMASDAKIKAYVDAEKAKDATLLEGDLVSKYLVSEAQNAVVDAYNDKVKKSTSFGWIKNIWVTDASYKNPVLSATEFKTEASREKFEVEGKKVKYGKISRYTNAYEKGAYNIVTEKLSSERKAANGYFILIALSIGTILLQQFVMQRSQKEQQKYSSVDGMAGSQQKMTMVIMTGMFAIFSFMYSSAFSIYLITSNLFSMGATLIINKFVDKSMEKKEVEASVKKFENHAAERIEKAKNAGRASAEESKKKNK